MKRQEILNNLMDLINKIQSKEASEYADGIIDGILLSIREIERNS